MIKKDMTIKEIIEKDSELIYVFENNGIKGLNNDAVLKQIGSMKLEDLLKLKKKNVEVFVDLLNESSKLEVVDLTLSQSKNEAGKIKVEGVLPCPVRMPLLEAFMKYENVSDVNHELKAASEGLDWLVDGVKAAETEDGLADVYITAGFDLFFDDDLMKKFKDQGTFKDLSGLTTYNKDFQNDDISLMDPNGDYSMLAVVPAVFLVNKSELGDRPMPKTWADILHPRFEGSVSLPVSDLDLFNAMLLQINKDFGEEGVRALGKSLVKSMHPSQMLMSTRETVRPAISIMPYFFTKMARAGGVMEAVWPEDGAIISPIFMLTKASKGEDVAQISRFFSSKEIGELLSHQGLFPTVNPEVDNRLGDNQFKWVGWDYINSNKIDEVLNRCEAIFREGLDDSVKADLK